jgi:PAS domain S-box-containing protein
VASRSGSRRPRAKSAPVPASAPSSASLFRLAFDDSSDLLVLMRVERDGRIFAEQMNASAERFFSQVMPEWFPDAWRKHDMETLYRERASLAPAQIAGILAPHRKAIRTRKPVRTSSELATPSGKRLLRRFTLTPLCSRGRVTHLFYHGVDLTPVRQAEERFERLFETSPVPLSIVRLADDTRLHANAAWLAFYGRGREEVIGRPTSALPTWVDLEERRRMLEVLRRDGGARGLVRVRAAGGVERDCLVSMAPISWDGADCMVAAALDVSELAVARRDAQAAAERFSKLFDLSPVPLVIGRHSDGAYLAANPAWLKLHGYSRQELEGQSSLTLGVWPSPADRTRVLAHMQKEGEVRALPTQFRTKDGNLISTLYYATLVDWLGEPAIMAAPQDVTELSRLRHEAELQREHFESLFRLSPNPSSVTTLADGRYLALNEAWANAMGFAPQEMLGQRALDLGVWPDAAERDRFITTLKERGALRQLPVRFRTRAGETRQMRISSELIQWAGATAILSSMHDVSDLEQARNEAQASSERFLQLFESNPVPITIARIPDGMLLEVNEAWLDFKGMTRAQAIGKTRDAVGSWVDRTLRDRVVAAVTAGNPVRNVPVRLRGRGEDVRDVLYSGIRVDWMGEAAIVAFVVDVTDIQRASDEIRRLNESLEQSVRERTAELEQANRDLESFSYTVSHDLRSPLGTINSFAHLLRVSETERLSADGARLLAMLEKDAARMAQLVDGLLEFSRLGRNPVTRTAISMDGLVKEVVDELHGTENARRTQFRVARLPGCQGDGMLLRQVWHNLIGNAAKYSRERDPGVVEIGYDEPAHAYFVRDNGVGFDMTHASKLFGMFERIHTDAEFEGTGIGLAHAARIVERHGGRIWFQAAPGSGATFYFTLQR